MKKDARLFALAITAGAVVLGGIAFARLGDSKPPADPRAAHVEAKRAEEVKLRFDQGVVMLHARQYEHALTAFHRVLELSPGMPEAHVNAGYALLGLKRYGAARDFFESATVLRPSQVNAYWGLAVALEALGDKPGAIGADRLRRPLNANVMRHSTPHEHALRDGRYRPKTGHSTTGRNGRRYRLRDVAWTRSQRTP
jgi:tetratricopeptide (TPR) repeat protein